MAEDKKFDLSPGSAAVYERGFVPALFEQWPPQITEAIKLQEGERVLDVACGTGVLTCECARRVGPTGATTGIDITQSLLDVARGKRPEVDWRQGDACTTLAMAGSAGTWAIRSPRPTISSSSSITATSTVYGRSGKQTDMRALRSIPDPHLDRTRDTS